MTDEKAPFFQMQTEIKNHNKIQLGNEMFNFPNPNPENPVPNEEEDKSSDSSFITGEQLNLKCNFIHFFLLDSSDASAQESYVEGVI